MKIQGPGEPAGPRKSDAAGRPTRPGPAAPCARIGSDRVDLSPRAKLIASLAETAGRLPEVRTEVVERTRRALDSPSSRLSALDLARAVIEFERGFRF